MKRTAALLAVTVATAGVAAPAALAAPKKKPITKTYEITVPTPDPTNYAGSGGVDGYSVCAQRVPQSFHTETFKVPAAGTLHVELTGYTGDMDLLLMDKDKEELAFGGSDGVNDSEVVDIKFKKATTAYIVGCNWAAAPTATVTYKFTFK